MSSQHRHEKPSFDPALAALPMSQKLELHITRLGLTTRANNCLSFQGIKTVGQLVRKSRAELLCIPNFGHRSLDEIVNVLAQLGMCLEGMALQAADLNAARNEKPRKPRPMRAAYIMPSAFGMDIRMAFVADDGARVVADLSPCATYLLIQSLLQLLNPFVGNRPVPASEQHDVERSAA